MLDGRRRRPGADRRRGRARLRALLPRRRVPLARERRRRARPVDRRRRRRGARRHGRGPAEPGGGATFEITIPLAPTKPTTRPPRSERKPDMTEHELTRRRLLELGLALPPLAALASTRRRARRDRRSPRRRRSRTTTTPTPALTEGPYFKPRSPLRRSIVPAGARRHAPDARRPRPHDERPAVVPKALIDFWQASASRRVRQQRLPLPRPPADRRAGPLHALHGRARASIPAARSTFT